MSAPGVRSSQAPERTELRALSWGTFRFTLPSGWEITSYLAAPDNGRLQFHHRTRATAQLHWRVVPVAPDQERILHALHEKNDRRTAHLKTTPIEVGARGAWLTGRIEHRTRIASLYQSPTQMLLQWLFEEGAANEGALDALLESYAPNDGPLSAWQLFGVGVTLPSSYAFASLTAQAASVSLTFERGTRRTIVARSMGMDRALLAQRSLAQLAHAEVHPARVLTQERRQFRDCSAVHSTLARWPERGLDALLGRPFRGESVLWHDAAGRRIYALTQWGAEPSESLVLGDVAQVGGVATAEPTFPGVDNVDIELTHGPANAEGAPEQATTGGASASATSLTPGAFDPLRALPLRNEGAAVEWRSDGTAAVSVSQVFPAGLNRLARALGAKPRRTFELDALGSALVQRLQHDRTAMDHIDWLAEEHALSFHEARVLVMKYLEMLLSRGVVAIAVPSSAVVTGVAARPTK